MFRIVLTSQAIKDARKIEKTGLKGKVLALIQLIERDPYAFPPRFEFLRETCLD